MTFASANHKRNIKIDIIYVKVYNLFNFVERRNIHIAAPEAELEGGSEWINH